MNAFWHAITAAVRESRGLTLAFWWNVALLAGSLAALPFDRRTILGLNPWVKPIKFEISIIVFLVTMALLLHVLIAERVQFKLWLGWIFGIAMIVENTIIAGQAARGVRSHMNFTSPFNSIAFAVMGLFIALNTVAVAALLWAFCTDRLVLPVAELWGIRLGLAMLLAGSVEGVRIVNQAGHTVGAPDGGAGLPFLNWSTLHGDLRVAHFFAIHALQIFWAAGWWLGSSGLPSRGSVAAIWGFAVVYAGGVWWLFAQGLAGRPLLALP